jgi:hypothetical protein
MRLFHEEPKVVLIDRYFSGICQLGLFLGTVCIQPLNCICINSEETAYRKNGNIFLNAG